MVTTPTLSQILDTQPFGVVLKVLLSMVNDLSSGKDEALAALRAHTDALGGDVLLIGGVAVIRHGYQRTTQDRDVLVDHRYVRELADRLMDDPAWERLEIRQYAFVHRPTSVPVDFLVSGDLMQLGRPYVFPDPAGQETIEGVEGIRCIGLHELLYLKLVAGRMRDLADVMELVKLHLDEVQPDRVLARIQPEDNDLREQFLAILKQAPIELANERRLGQR
jgi:hypothetical protein